MEQRDKLFRNIKVLEWVKASRMFMIAMAVIVPFFNQIGLDQGQIYQLQALFSISIVLLEVPSGYFADRYGRRLSIILGMWTYAAAFCFYATAGSFHSLLLIEVLLAVSVSFVSGADVALRFDSLAALGLTDDYLKHDSRASAKAAFAEGIAGLIGGALALINLRAPLVGQAIFCVLTLPLAYMLVEPPLKRADSSQHPWRAVANVTKHALIENTGIRWLLLYNALLSTVTYTAVWLMQPYYSEVGVPLGLFGLMWFFKHMFLWAFSLEAERIKNRLGLDRLMLTLPVVGVATYLVLGFGSSLMAIPAFIGFEFVRGTLGPVMRDEINKLIDQPEFRATVNSVGSFTTRISFTVFALISGFWFNKFGLFNTLIASGVMYAALCAIMLFALTRRQIIKVG